MTVILHRFHEYQNGSGAITPLFHTRPTQVSGEQRKHTAEHFIPAFGIPTISLHSFFAFAKDQFRSLTINENDFDDEPPTLTPFLLQFSHWYLIQKPDQMLSRSLVHRND
ncbi:hypothetical protein EVAR_95642_1 [Eumeta japonica]|uniref:Uncharacterized protein n=1 Tax=Eumeta variegata TaxID=151549 RepID=A0A4C2ACG9_EUMVA|nr:hypothetical protein EVAR_95642_1 [Eumeta japonica]